MSKFFAGDSESESESSVSDEEEQEQKPTIAKPAFMVSDEEEDEDEGKREVKSAKVKRHDELKSIVKQLKNQQKIHDISKVLASFEELARIYEKAKKVIEREGHAPMFYVRGIAELMDYIEGRWEDREWRSTMNKINSKSLHTLRQKLRKYTRDFEDDIRYVKENPTADTDSEPEMDEPEAPAPSGAEIFRKDSFPREEPEQKSESDESDSEKSEGDDFWSSSGSSESDDDEGKDQDGDIKQIFMKKSTDAQPKEPGVVKEKISKKPRDKQKLKKDASAPDGDWVVKPGQLPEKGALFPKDTEITVAACVKKLNEILAVRGKKGTNRREQIALIGELREIVRKHKLGPCLEAKILFSLISAVFDYNQKVSSSMMPEIWEKCTSTMDEILTLLEENPSILASENIPEDSENFEDSENYRVRGCILTIFEKMDDEYTKILQTSDAHATEYVDRLKDEGRICQILEHLQRFLESRTATPSQELCRIYLKRIEHTYYKYDYASVRRQSNPNLDEPVVAGADETRRLIDDLCKFIYTHDKTDRIRARALLCHVYHHALHDRWFEARDLMLMSHMQDTIQHADIPLQILYNRTMVQLGFCAFRNGYIKDAHQALNDVQSANKSKELLAQGMQMRNMEKTAEQEKTEKQRLMPYHMHINLELLECIYLVSAMLIEIPYLVSHEFDTRRRMISKQFHYQMKMSDRQALLGPPENMREHVVAASKAMKTGDWKACVKFLINEKMNQKVWHLLPQADRVREMLISKIKEESLRTYMFAFSPVYDSVSLPTLAEMFALDETCVHSIISKMILNEELMASLDEPSSCVVMHRTEPSKLQSLALQLSEKIINITELNEKIAEFKTNRGSQNTYQRQQGQGYQSWGGGGGHDRGYQDRGYQDRGHDRGYQDRGHDRGYQDRGQDRGYQDRGYQDRGYQDRGYQDRGYQDRGYDRGYGHDRGGRGHDRGGRGYDRGGRGHERGGHDRRAASRRMAQLMSN